MNTLVVSLLEFPYQISPGWDKMLESKKINADSTGRIDVRKSVQYYKLRKLKEMLKQNQNELKENTDPGMMQSLMEVHVALKQVEMSITKELGTVIMQ
jgi:DNA primase